MNASGAESCGVAASWPTLAPPSVPRLLAAGSADYAAHLRAFGALDLGVRVPALRSHVDASGLTGRGGAGFPTARKVASVQRSARVRGFRTVSVVANGAEGEPLSSKDAWLLRLAPHTVIDGLLLTGALLGTTSLVLYARPDQLSAVSAALAERPDAGAVRLHESPDTFLSGEASAVVAGIGGRAPLPVDHRDPLSEAGYRGRPTLVQNVETLANIALIARFGAAWFRSIGTEADPGSRLLSVSECDSRGYGDPRVLEVESGLSVERAIAGAGIDVDRVQAVLVGGFYGTWVPRAARATPISRDGLASWDATPGAGVLMTLDESRCPLIVSAEIASYLAVASARQCGPCANGLPALALILSRLAAREPTPALAQELHRLGSAIAGRGSCHHPDGTVRFVLSTLRIFAAEVDAHLGGRCLEVHE